MQAVQSKTSRLHDKEEVVEHRAKDDSCKDCGLEEFFEVFHD